jgi:hypothetical protein
MRASLRALLESIVDYAGTFPPARLELADAARRYAAYRAGPHALLLGRFVVPAAKLGELEAGLGGGAAPRNGPWPLTVTVSADPGGEVERALDFVRRFEGRVRVMSVEVPPLEPARIREAAAALPRGLETFFEVPLDADLEARLSAVAAAGGAAKVRTGGLSAESFPPAAGLAAFLAACARARLPFKATAGLHHPFSGPRPLEDAPGGRAAPMHGFLNLAVAAALLHAGRIGAEEAREALEERSKEPFRFEERGLTLRGRALRLSEIEDARRRFFRSFGACSFEEPVAGLEEMRGP